jgi:hypothetical protein
VPPTPDSEEAQPLRTIVVANIKLAELAELAELGKLTGATCAVGFIGG